MPELRWILLGAGVALILGLWWWETRKARAKPAADEEAALAHAPTAQDGGDMAAFADDEVAQPEAHYAPTIERVRVPRRPPLIEIPDDVEVDVSDFVGRDRRHPRETAPRLEPQFEFDTAVGDAAIETEALQQFEADDGDHRPPWISTQPLERDEVAPKPAPESDEPPLDPDELRTVEASRQRIVALRLVAAGGRWGGRELRVALEAEGLSFGPYSIFHREREDGKSLLYVASMMEPGSFDLASMDGEEFAGISLFGVVPGPLDAPSTFDLVLSVGRNLAERIKGQLQDEQGSTLTAQRILNLREELVHFEHRNRRLRRS